MSNYSRGQVQSPDQLNYTGNNGTYHEWTEGVTITPVKRADSSVREQRQQALNTAKEKAKNDLKRILAKHGHDFKSARKNKKLWKKVKAAYQKRKKEYFQEIVSNRQNNRSNVRNQISQVNPKWDSMRGINLEYIHTTLDIAGMIPGLGIVPDALNTGLYIIEGDWANAGFSALAMLPLIGQGATATKRGIKVTEDIVKNKKRIKKALRKAKIDANKMRGVKLPKPKFEDSNAWQHFRKHSEGFDEKRQLPVGVNKKGEIKEGYVDNTDIARDTPKYTVDTPEFKTQQEYQKAAEKFFSGSSSKYTEQFIREGDGAIIRYDHKSGLFGIMSKEGNIQTFYRPDEGLQHAAQQALKKGRLK